MKINIQRMASTIFYSSNFYCFKIVNYNTEITSTNNKGNYEWTAASKTMRFHTTKSELLCCNVYSHFSSMLLKCFQIQIKKFNTMQLYFYFFLNCKTFKPYMCADIVIIDFLLNEN